MSNPHLRLTDASEFFDALDGGVFREKLERAFSEVAAAAVDLEKVGEVTLKFKFKAIGNYQVQVSHELRSKEPTRRGSSQKDDTTESMMHVGRGGRMTAQPESQMDAFKTES